MTDISTPTPCLTLHGLLPPSEPSIPLRVSLRTEQLTNGWTGQKESHRVLRATNGIRRYEWRLEGLIAHRARGRDFDAVTIPGDMWVSGFRAVLDAVEAGKVRNCTEMTDTTINAQVR